MHRIRTTFALAMVAAGTIVLGAHAPDSRAQSLRLDSAAYLLVDAYRYDEARRFIAGWNRGVDVVVQNGTVRAPVSGRVRFVGEVAGRGVATIDTVVGSMPVVVTLTGMITDLRAGERVRRGQVVGSGVLVHIGAYDPRRRTRYLPVVVDHAATRSDDDGVSGAVARRLTDAINGTAAPHPTVATPLSTAAFNSPSPLPSTLRHATPATHLRIAIRPAPTTAHGASAAAVSRPALGSYVSERALGRDRVTADRFGLQPSIDTRTAHPSGAVARAAATRSTGSRAYDTIAAVLSDSDRPSGAADSSARTHTGAVPRNMLSAATLTRIIGDSTAGPNHTGGSRPRGRGHLVGPDASGGWSALHHVRPRSHTTAVSEAATAPRIQVRATRPRPHVPHVSRGRVGSAAASEPSSTAEPTGFAQRLPRRSERPRTPQVGARWTVVAAATALAAAAHSWRRRRRRRRGRQHVQPGSSQPATTCNAPWIPPLSLPDAATTQHEPTSAYRALEWCEPTSTQDAPVDDVTCHRLRPASEVTSI